MKALKEKRVSLRSLFRRGLVILSLFALVFASCGGSGSSNGDYQDGYDKGLADGLASGGGASADPVVVDMVVQKHPVMPSYEGGMPDLTGLEVMIFWDKTNPPEVVKDITKFDVYPPVAYVEAAGAHITEISPKGRYTVQYNAAASTATRVNVYIPAVIAMWTTQGVDTTTGTPALPRVVGPIPAVYEDVGIDAEAVAGVKFRAKYDASGATAFTPDVVIDAFASIPSDLGYNQLTTAARSYNTAKNPWPTIGGTADSIREVPVSSSAEAWEANYTRPTATAPGTAAYYYGLGREGYATAKTATVDITNFYYVDKLVSDGFTGTLEPVAADAEAIYASASATSYPKVDWVDRLDKAGAKFTVIYYIPKPEPEGVKKTRSITMKDYIKAMYTMGADGKPKAIVPIVSGADPGTAVPVALTTAGAESLTAASILRSVQYGYDLSLVLAYYDPLIQVSDPGKGTLTGGVIASQNPNQCTIPLTANNLIYEFADEIELVRRDASAHEGVPEMRYTLTPTQANRVLALYDSLQTYYDVCYRYTGPTGSTPILVKIPLTGAPGGPKWPARSDATPIKGGLDDTLPEAVEERQVTYQFPAPFSASATAVGTVEYDFTYNAIP